MSSHNANINELFKFLKIIHNIIFYFDLFSTINSFNIQ